MTDVHGPIDFVLLEFTGGNDLSATAAALIDLVERGVVRLYDLLAIRKEEAGTFSMVELDALGNEMTVMEDLWTRLRLDGWERAQPVLQAYVDGLKGYQTNKLKPISKKDKEAVYQHWASIFEAFGYSREYPPPTTTVEETTT